MSTFYLKYRPGRTEDLDLENVRTTLKNIFKKGRIPHAFLFIGPRGAGKTSAARIIAKAVNCLSPDKEQEPCNKCSQCMTIASGSNLDVIEIDAASHRGIDDIRALRDAVKLSPVSAKKKVYIIDECHMLTTEASNALLKTLEEPPEHVIFVLATTEGEKVLPTIKSRCTILYFRKASPEEIMRSLKKVVDGEKLKIKENVLQEIARNVDGSFREAHKILEVLVSSGQYDIKKVREVLALSSVDVDDLVKAVIRKDAKHALASIEQAMAYGVDIKEYGREFLRILHQIFLSQHGLQKMTGYEIDREQLDKALDIFSQAVATLPGAVVPQLPLELAVAKFCEGKRDNESENENEKENFSTKEDSLKIDYEEELSNDGASMLSQEELQNCWEKVLSEVKNYNFSIEALLRATRPSTFTGKKLIIEVFYKFHKERLESDQYRSIIEKAASKILGTKVGLVWKLSKQTVKASHLLENFSEDVDEDIVQVAEEIFGGKKEDRLTN